MSDDFKYCVDIPPRLSGLDGLNRLLLQMSDLGGSDMFLMGGSRVWLSLFGRKEKITKRNLSEKEVIGLLQSFYGVNAPAKLGSGEPIDTAYEFIKINDEGRKERLRFRVNAVSCLRAGRNSLTITLREIPTTPKSVKDLGVENEIINTSRQASQGLILVVGATGSGKSTLLSAVLRDQLEEEGGHRNLVTVESPIEFVYDDIIKPTSIATQLEVGRHVDSFSSGVVNSLRMAPTTILVGEARDYETVSCAVEASVTGHVVFSTVHANSVAETFQRMVSVYPEAMQLQAKNDLVQAIKLVVAQRLLITVDGKRTAIREYMTLNQKIKNEMVAAENVGIKAFEMVAKYGKPMTVDIQEKYDEGLISEPVYKAAMANYSGE